MYKALKQAKDFGLAQIVRVQRSAAAGFYFWRVWLRSLYFSDEVNFYADSFIRVVFGLYYIPSIVVAIALTHSAIERVVWVLVVPVTQDMERNPYHFSSLQTLSAGLSRIAVRVAPFAALGLSLATVGHKALNCFVEAMMDAYTTHKRKDYPLMHARLQFVVEKRTRVYTFVGVMVVLATVIVYTFQQDTIVVLFRDEPYVLVAAAVVAVAQGLFVFATVIGGAPDEMLDAFTDSVVSVAEKWTGLTSPMRAPLPASSLSSPLPSSFASPRMGAAAVSTTEYVEHPWHGGGGGSSGYGTPRLLSPRLGPSLPRSVADSAVSSTESSLYGDGLLRSNCSGSGGGSGSVFDPLPHALPGAMPFITYFLGDWWTHNIWCMRHIGFSMALIFAVLVSLGSDPIRGLTSAVLLIMCLNFPHLFGYVSLMVSFAVTRTMRSFNWLLRHPDAVLPFLVVALPYQVVLLNALFYFRHYPFTCALLLVVNVLLVARAIDLVREYDVSGRGSVRWEDAGAGLARAGAAPSAASTATAAGGGSLYGACDSGTGSFVRTRCVVHVPAPPPPAAAAAAVTSETVTVDKRGKGRKANSGNADPSSAGVAAPPPLSTAVAAASVAGTPTIATHRLVTPALAIILEDAYEKHHVRPDLVSLDMTLDIKHMRIRYVDAKNPDVPLVRHQVVPYGTARRFLRDRHFYGYTYPRLLSLQSPGYFAGATYRRARTIMRVVSITALLLFALLVFGMIVQAAFPQLRSIPVRVSAPTPGQSSLLVDHVVIRMQLLARAGVSQASLLSALPSAVARTAGAVPDAAHVVFQWHNITSPVGEDFYPSLCRREFFGTTVWELSLLALAPYLFNVDEVDTLIDFMNTHLGSDWMIRRRHGHSCNATDSAHAPTGWAGFYDFYSAARETSVVAVRGTDLFRFEDFLIDVNLFFETVLYQLMTFIVPGAIVVPKELVVNLVRMVALRGSDSPAEDVGNTDGAYAAFKARHTWAALVAAAEKRQREAAHARRPPPPMVLHQCRQNNYQRDFYANVANHLTYVASNEAAARPKHVVLTGHSLGGAVAAIVGAQMELPTVAFSSPGIALARKKFNVELRSIHKNVVTVMSSNDLVPGVGVQGGEVHHVECLAAKRELCHAIEFTIGSLWRSCSSVRKRFPGIADLI